MPSYELECTGCGAAFTAKSSRAKWHSPACKKKHQRKAKPETEESVVDQAGDGADHEPTANSTYGRDVLEAVRRDLEKAGQLDTVDGRIAMYLARKSIDPDAKNPAALFKQMRDALDAALSKGTPVEPNPTDPAAEEDDEVTRARNARKEARQAAGLS